METPGRESYAAKTAQAHDDESVAATITGCLVHDDDMFQLKDTDGEQAPKARSWKSGFIRRSSAKVHVLASDGLSLKSHVGHRVSVSGMLTDRELHARSVRATSERCD
jgi:hypothetical protein